MAGGYSHEDMESLRVELRGLREELRAYTRRHEREHEAIVTEARYQHERLSHEVADLEAAILPAVRANTEERIRTAGRDSVLKWLIGSNLGVIAAVMIAALALLRDAGAI